MRPSDDSIVEFVTGEWIPTFLCCLLALVTGICGVAALFIQWLANMNYHFSRWPHVAIFLVGWLTVLVSFYASYRMICYPALRSLWFGVVAIGFIGLDLWLYSLPLANGLFH